jgi:hypothetical protein
MTDINDLVQEFWGPGTLNDGAVGTSFFATLRLLEILQECFDILEVPVCFVISVLRLPSTKLKKSTEFDKPRIQSQI